MRTRNHYLFVCLGSCLLALFHLGWGAIEVRAQATRAISLRQISVEGSDSHAVVTLKLDGKNYGVGVSPRKLQEIATPPIRIFIDLPNIISHVASDTPVYKGGVDRVRVGLNQSSPPITRVVLDLSRRSAYRLEEDVEGNLLRIIVGTPESPHLFEPTIFSSVDYLKWFEHFSSTLDRLLLDQKTGNAEAWKALLADIQAETQPSLFEVSHDLLATAAKLGVVSSREGADASGRSAEAESALAGARLIHYRAKALVKAALAQ